MPWRRSREKMREGREGKGMRDKKEREILIFFAG
jgi:hypothetical protein